MNSNLILIRPVRAGKSTVAKLISERLGLPQISTVVFITITIEKSADTLAIT